jgi:hypothetical protein
LRHELWRQNDGLTFCFAGPRGDQARSMLSEDAELIWTVEAESWFEAMTKYHEYLGWGEYTSEFAELDKQTYEERGWE